MCWLVLLTLMLLVLCWLVFILARVVLLLWLLVVGIMILWGGGVTVDMGSIMMCVVLIMLVMVLPCIFVEIIIDPVPVQWVQMIWIKPRVRVIFVMMPMMCMPVLRCLMVIVTVMIIMTPMVSSQVPSHTLTMTTTLHAMCLLTLLILLCMATANVLLVAHALQRWNSGRGVLLPSWLVLLWLCTIATMLLLLHLELLRLDVLFSSLHVVNEILLFGQLDLSVES